MERSENERFLFGLNRSTLTLTKQFFDYHRNLSHWLFQVHHLLKNGESLSQYQMKINRGPQNGSCSMNPFNGTIETDFRIRCVNWSDEDQIKDYSFYCSSLSFSVFSSMILCLF